MSDLSERLSDAARALKHAQRERDTLIIRASEAGFSRRQVARAVGLSPAGVQHILHRYRRENGARR